MDINPKRFFSTTKKGENHELRVDLNSEYRDKRKETVKKVIANMTIGKDVSSLFADVVKNMQTEDLELKKLVYLYLMNYAKSQPELVILAVNTFVKDSDDHNPLIRALAIRTMSCLRVEKIIDYLLEPLKKSLQDSDPYVRKTAAICVAKLFDLNPGIAIDNGLISILQEMLSDRNPMVIANAVAALTEISEASVQKDIFTISDMLLQKLLAALNECTEWGQICILSSLAGYNPRDSREAGDIVERVIPRLQHANASVVLSAVKVLMMYLSHNYSDELNKTIVRKLSPPLVTLIASEPEIQYVALRNINLILQKRPEILAQEIRVFFTKYNDPPYVKLEKLEVIIKLCSENNVDQVLSELKEYANEVDVDFVRKSIRAISRCAIKIPSAADKAVQVLLDLIKSGVNYVIQESIIVMKDIFRAYPSKYEGIIPILCQNLESLDEADAKASLIWIVGEYADRIENSSQLLEYFLETFKEDASKVKLQVVTASVKLFLRKPAVAQKLVQDVLQIATQSVENPDIRDRAYIYWRLLSANPQAAKAVVLAEKPPIESDTSSVSETLLDELLANLSSLASVYHKSPALLGVSGSSVDLSSYRDGLIEGDEDGESRINAVKQAAQAMGGTVIENLLDLDFSVPVAQPDGGLLGTATSATSSPVRGRSAIDDLLSMDDPVPLAGSPFAGLPSSAPGRFSVTGAVDILPHTPLLDPLQSQGLEITGTFSRRAGIVYQDLKITNKSTTPMTDFAIQYNVNTFGLAATVPLTVTPNPLPVGMSCAVSLPLGPGIVGVQKMDIINAFQVAVKNQIGVYYFQTLGPLHVFLVDDPALGASTFSSLWGSAGVQELKFSSIIKKEKVNDLSFTLKKNGYAVVNSSAEKIQVLAKTTNGVLLAGELALSSAIGDGIPISVTVKSESGEFAALVQPNFEALL